jgi:hypothetical protein
VRQIEFDAQGGVPGHVAGKVTDYPFSLKRPCFSSGDVDFSSEKYEFLRFLL